MLVSRCAYVRRLVYLRQRFVRWSQARVACQLRHREPVFGGRGGARSAQGTRETINKQRPLKGRHHPQSRFMSTRPSTTLADLLRPPLVANPFSAVRASLRRGSSDEFENSLAHGGQGWVRRRPVDCFFPALLF